MLRRSFLALAVALLVAPAYSAELEIGAHAPEFKSLPGVDGKEYGAVDAVEHYPASDMLVVAGTLVPMVAAIVHDINLAARRIVVDPPAGLF